LIERRVHRGKAVAIREVEEIKKRDVRRGSRKRKRIAGKGGELSAKEVSISHIGEGRD